MSEARAPVPTRPGLGFLGWGAANESLYRLLTQGGAGATMRILPPARGERIPRVLRAVASAEALLQESGFVFVDMTPTDWRHVLPSLRLAISDRNVIVLSGQGLSIAAASRHLHERKLIRCLLTPHRTPEEAILAFHTAPWVRREDAEAFSALFAHLAQALEIREEAQFEVVRALSGIAPAVLYTAADALADGALMMGLPRAQALPFLAGVLLGAARAMQGGQHPAILRESALGVEPAAAGLMELESAGMRGLMMRVVEQAVRQIRRAEEPETAAPQD
jgi:pyrroline-5-carboxylate reductase